MNHTDKQTLLHLAHESILWELEGRDCQIDTTKISDTLKQQRGTFVTLTIHGALRGCIGHIIPVQELYKDVMENACSAAFFDSRFMPLTKEEFKKTAIDISVLSKPRAFKYDSLNALLENLERNKPGVVLKKGGRMATFLPQVWEELPNVQDFLSHLCVKAGLASDVWTRGVEIETYSVEKIS